MSSTDIKQAKLSGFITGLAWSFIVLAGFSVLIAILQYVMLSLLPMDEIFTAMKAEQGVPPVLYFLFEHFRAIAAVIFIFSVVAIVASVGLLMRRNWARLLFLAMMIVIIVSHLGGLLMPFYISTWLPSVPQDMPAEFGNFFDMMMKVSMVFGALVTLITIGFCAWVMKRLMSEEIRKEFLPL